jgi:predicted ATP-dependent endonuclease of OLD family
MIKKAVIHNYRSCLKTEVDLHPELTVLIGANGVGKTNILRALELVSKIDNTRRIDSEVLAYLEGYHHTNVELFIDIDDNSYKLETSIVYFDDSFGESNIKIADISYEDLNSAAHHFIDLDTIQYRHLLKKARLNSLSPEVRKEQAIIASFKSISYYSASQFVDSSKCPLSVELNPFKPGNLSAFAGKDHTTYLLDLYLCSKNKDSNIYDQYLHLIGEESLGLVEEIRFKDQKIPIESRLSVREIKNGTKKEQVNRMIITPLFKVDGSYLSPNQLSDGTFKMLALVFYIISDENHTLLIEEPEVSIHHGLLDSLIELIKQESKYKQIIVSTHSELVLDAVQPENVLVVKKEQDKGTLAKSLTDNLSQDDYRALKKYLETEGNLGEYWRETGLEYE